MQTLSIPYSVATPATGHPEVCKPALCCVAVGALHPSTGFRFGALKKTRREP